MIQEIIVAIIGIAVLGLVIQRIYHFFRSDNKSEGACGCSSCHCNTTKIDKRA